MGILTEVIPIKRINFNTVSVQNCQKSKDAHHRGVAVQTPIKELGKPEKRSIILGTAHGG